MSEATRRSYDRVAARYAAEISDELAGKPLDRAMLNAFAELTSGPVLDIGAGPGHVANYLSQQGLALIATDLSPAMCTLAHGSALAAVAAGMTALPFDSAVAGGIICLYSVIHLSAEERAVAYAEFNRVLRPGGLALVAFHTSDADLPKGGEKAVSSWWGSPVDLTFRFLDPDLDPKRSARPVSNSRRGLTEGPVQENTRADGATCWCAALLRAALLSERGCRDPDRTGGGRPGRIVACQTSLPKPSSDCATWA